MNWVWKVWEAVERVGLFVWGVFSVVLVMACVVEVAKFVLDAVVELCAR